MASECVAFSLTNMCATLTHTLARLFVRALVQWL